MKSRRLLVVAVAAATVIAACGSDDDGASTVATDGDTAATVSGSAATGPTEADVANPSGDTVEPTTTNVSEDAAPSSLPSDVNRDAVIRVGWSLAPRNMDPHTANTLGDYPFLSLVYDRLVNLSSTESLEPMLATDWSFGDDGSTLSMTLRDDVIFQDGTPFNADAVKANIDRALTLETSTIKGLLSSIDSVEVDDSTHVTFNLVPGGGGGLLYAFTERPGMMISPQAFDLPDLDQYGVGTGPYVVKSGTFQPAQEATFERAEGEYWAGEDARPFAEIQMIAMPDQETRFNALESGQIDLAPVSAVSTDRAVELGDTDAFNTAIYDARTYYFVGFNSNTAALQNPLVREAIAHSIDKQGLNDAVFGGRCPTTSQMPLEGDASYDPTLEDAYSYDPERARELLAEAGVENLDLTGVLITTEPMSSQAIAIQAMLNEVGINWDISTSLSSQEGLPAWTDGQFDLHAYISAGRADPVAMYEEARTRNAPGGFPASADTALAAAQDPTLSVDARAEAVKAMNQAMVQDFGMVYICHPQESLIGRSNIVGLDQIPWMRYGVYSVQSLAMVDG